MAVSTITITAARSEVCVFSWPYEEEKIGILSRKPSLLPKGRAIFWPFGLPVWLSVLASVHVFVVTLWLMAKVIGGEEAFTLGFCFRASIRSLFSQGIV